MKTRFLKILALLLALSCLFGCAPAQSPETQPPTEATVPPVEETEPPVEESQPPVALHYDYPEWNFSLTLPEQWAGKFSLVEDEIGVTFQLGDTSILSFVTVKNEPGAKELNDRLIAEDYTFHHDNGSQALFYKELSDIPMEYQIYQRGLKKPILHTEDILEEFWKYDKTFSEEFNGLTLTKPYSYHSPQYLLMKSPHYVSYRLGIDFTLPEEFMKNWNIGLQLLERGISVNLLYDWENDGLNGDPQGYELYDMRYISREEFEQRREDYEKYPANLRYVFEDEVYLAGHLWYPRMSYDFRQPWPPFADDTPSIKQVMDAILEIKILTEEEPDEVDTSFELNGVLYENNIDWDYIFERLEQ